MGQIDKCLVLAISLYFRNKSVSCSRLKKVSLSPAFPTWIFTQR